jgi:transposase InsO family protein
MNNKRTSENTVGGREYLAIDGRMYKIVRTSGVEITAMQIDSLKKENFTIGEIFSRADVVFAETLPELRDRVINEPAPPVPIPTTAIDPDLLERADWQIQTVTQIDAIVAEKQRICDAANTDFRKTPTLRQACAEYSRDVGRRVGLDCYYKYRRRCQEFSMDRIAIAASLQRSDCGKSRLSPAQHHYMETAILQLYADRAVQLTPETIYRYMEALLHRLDYWWINPEKCRGPLPHDLIDTLFRAKIPIETIRSNPESAQLLDQIALPSRTTFRGYLKWFIQNPGDSKQAVIDRYGQAAWDRHHKIFDDYVRIAARTLQYVFGDHLKLKLPIQDDSGVTVTLWLTLLIDAWSRCVLGYVLLPGAPSITSIQSALRHAIWPKSEEELQGWGIELPWICYGIPDQLSLDNAWAHHSVSLENLPRAISSNGQFTRMYLDFRPPYRARYGAIVERLFGNFTGRLREFVPQVIDNARRHATRTAALHVSDVRRAIAKLIVLYHHEPHSELNGLTPHERWLNGIEEFGLPIVPPRTQQMEMLFWVEHPGTRTITEKGLRLFGMRYTVESNVLRRRPDGKSITYTIRYTPEDISRVAVFKRVADGPQVDELFVGLAHARELMMSDSRLKPFSLAEREFLKELSKQTEPGDRKHWLAFVEEMIGLARGERNQHTEAPKSRRSRVGATAKNRAEKFAKPKSDADEHSRNLLQSFASEDE